MRGIPRARLVRRFAGGCALVALLAVTGCNHSAEQAQQVASDVASAPTQSQVRLDINPAEGAQNVKPAQPVTVAAHEGTLSSVTLTDSTGTPVQGTLSPNGATWTFSGTLSFATTYAVSVTATDSAKRPKQVVSSFTTLKPAATTYPSVIPLNGETVGVGIPIIIYWSQPVHDRAAAEKLLTVTANKPVEGAWHWYSDKEVHYRPKTYWPAYTHVTIDILAQGADLGGGVYGEATRHITFTVGSSVISRVNNATHSMTVSQDGRALRTMSVSLGKAATPSSSGTMVVFEKYKDKYFDSASFGVPRSSSGGYYTKVYWDTKYTFGGEYVHAAPWSVRDQGHRNVSHGCVNVTTENAKWFYNLSKRGDLVIIAGTGRQVRPGDGWTDWNLSWDDWVAGSALA